MIYVFRFLGFLLIPIIVNGVLRLLKQNPRKYQKIVWLFFKNGYIVKK